MTDQPSPNDLEAPADSAPALPGYVEFSRLPDGKAVTRVSRRFAEAVLNEHTPDGVNRRLPDSLFEFLPWGRRVVVLRYPPPKISDIIEDPDPTKQRIDKGLVLAAGPEVGVPVPGADPARMPCPWRGADLVGRDVQFARHAGTPVAFPESDEASDSYVRRTYGDRATADPYIVMTDMDLWGEWHGGDAPETD